MKRLKVLLVLHLTLDAVAVFRLVRSTLDITPYDDEQHANVELPWLPHCPSMCQCYRTRHALIDIVRTTQGQELLRRSSSRPALRTVNCSHRSLIRFPDDIPPDVEAMLMDGNLLTGFAFHHGVSHAFGSSTNNVVLLNVSNNNIRNLQGGRLELPSLKTLDLSHNFIDAIKLSNAAFFIPLRNLTSLDLSYNNINYVHADVLQLSRLVALDISGNLLKELDLNLLAQLPALRELHAGSNLINHVIKLQQQLHVREGVEKIERRQRLEPSSTHLIHALDVLDLAFNQLELFGYNNYTTTEDDQNDEDVASSLATATSSTLSFSPSALSIQVRRLILGGNPVQHFYSNAFVNLTLLEQLELNYMPQLTVIHERAFSFLPNLMSVDLHHNIQLQYIYNDAFNFCPSVAEVNVGDCPQLLYVPSRLLIEQVDRLQHINITNTGLSCAFNWPWLTQYFSGTNALFKTKVITAADDDRAPQSLAATNPADESSHHFLCRLPNATLITVRNALAHFSSLNSSSPPQPEVIILGASFSSSSPFNDDDMTTSDTTTTAHRSRSSNENTLHYGTVHAVAGQRLELACLCTVLGGNYYAKSCLLKWKHSVLATTSRGTSEVLKSNATSVATTSAAAASDGDSHRDLQSERRLIVDPIMPFDAGQYECEAVVPTNNLTSIKSSKFVNLFVNMQNISFSAKVLNGASRATLYWNNSDVGMARYFSILYQSVSDSQKRQFHNDDKWREICTNQGVVNFDPRSARGQHCKIGDGGGVEFALEGGKTYNACLAISRPSYADWLYLQPAELNLNKRTHHFIACVLVPIASSMPASPTLGLATAYEITVVGIALAASLAVCVCCGRCVCNVYWQHKIDRRLSAGSVLSPFGSSAPLRHSISLVMLENSFYSRTPSAPGTPVAFSNAGLDVDTLRDADDETPRYLTVSRNGVEKRECNHCTSNGHVKLVDDDDCNVAQKKTAAIRPASIPLSAFNLLTVE